MGNCSPLLLWRSGHTDVRHHDGARPATNRQRPQHRRCHHANDPVNLRPVLRVRPHGACSPCRDIRPTSCMAPFQHMVHYLEHRLRLRTHQWAHDSRALFCRSGSQCRIRGAHLFSTSNSPLRSNKLHRSPDPSSPTAGAPRNEGKPSR